MPQRKYFGFVRHSDCYHASPDCPVIKHVKGKVRIEVREYDDESKAIVSGHQRRCRLCLGDKAITIEGQKSRVFMSDEQHAVLKIIANIYGKNGAMTLRQISEKRGRSVVSTYLIVRRLRADGLVEHKLKIGGRRASGGSIVPTKRGLSVIAIS